MNDTEQLSRFRVSYHTKPSPALSYYKGSIVVAATDAEDAENTAKRELARQAPEYRNSIAVDEVEEL